jgi:tetratricopeptide (TPR) repeat protein
MSNNNDLSKTRVFKTILKTKIFKNEFKNNNYGFYENMKIPGLPNTVYISMITSVGGFASIHKIYNTVENKFYAMKIPHKKYYNQSQICRMFLEEANKLSIIDSHPNIVSYKNFITWNNIPLIITNFIEGFSLDKIIHNENKNNYFMRISDYLGAFIEISRGMSFLQEKNNHTILHLDLKPSNIMYDTNDSSLKIIDFGISRTLLKSSEKTKTDSEDIDSKIIGTYPYMSPEHFDGIENCTKTSDIYSMGIILYEMITNKKPFLARKKEEYAKLHKSKKIDTVLGCDKELESIILKCLEKSPKDRYQNFSELVNDFEKLYTKITNENYPVKILSDNYNDLLLKAHRSLNIGELSNSLDLINKHIKKYPNDIEAFISKSFILLQKHSYNESLKIVDSILENEGKNLKALIIKGYILAKREDYENAIKYFSFVLKEDPIFYVYLNASLAEAYLNNLEIDKATKVIKKSLEADPNQFEFISVKSRILFFTRHENETIELIEKYLKVDWNGNFHSLWGNALNDIGKGHRAINKLSKIAKKFNYPSNICNTIGNIYFKMNEFVKALSFYKKSYINNPENINYLNNILNCYCELNNFEDINTIFSEFYKNNILTGSLYNSFGNAFMNLGKFNSAINCYEKALNLEPENPNFATNIILFYLKTNDLYKCEAFIRNWLNINTTNSSFLNAVGMYYYHKSDFSKSENYYKNSIYKSPFNSLYASNLINLYIKTNSLKDAENFSKLWLSQKRGCEHFYYTVGTLYIKLDSPETALENFKLSHEKSPYNLSYIKQLVETLLRLEKIEDALKYSTEFLNNNSKSNISYLSNELGISFLNIKKLDLALNFFKKSIGYDTQNVNSATNILCTYKLMKRYNDAILFSNNWISENKTNEYFWIQCGYIYHEIKNFNKSYDCFKKSLFLNPNLYESIRYFLYSVVQIGKFNEGVEFAKKWILNNKSTVEINNLLGLCYYNLKLFNKALKCFKSIIDIDSSNPYHFANYICTLLYLSKDIEAEKNIEAWLKDNNPNDYFYNTLGLCYLNLAMYNKSLKNFKNALKINPKIESYAHNYFKSLRHQSKITEAIKFAENWKKNNKISSDFLNHLGLCYFETHEYIKASLCFFEALSNTPDNATIAANYIVSLVKSDKKITAQNFSKSWSSKYISNDLLTNVTETLLNQ